MNPLTIQKRIAALVRNAQMSRLTIEIGAMRVPVVRLDTFLQLAQLLLQRQPATATTTVESQIVMESEAAPYIGFSVAWMRVARIQGRGPTYIRNGRAIRYRIADLDAFLNACRVEPSPNGRNRWTGHPRRPRPKD